MLEKGVAYSKLRDSYVKKLNDAVRKARANKEWRREYMTLLMRDLENQEIGREEGRELGREEERRNQIAEMLEKGKTPEDIADFCGYPIELVRKIQKNLFVAR